MRMGDFDSAFLALERLQELPSGVLGLQAASDARLLARTLRCRLSRRSSWADAGGRALKEERKKKDLKK